MAVFFVNDYFLVFGLFVNFWVGDYFCILVIEKWVYFKFVVFMNFSQCNDRVFVVEIIQEVVVI